MSDNAEIYKQLCASGADNGRWVIIEYGKATIFGSEDEAIEHMARLDSNDSGIIFDRIRKANASLRLRHWPAKDGDEHLKVIDLAERRLRSLANTYNEARMEYTFTESKWLIGLIVLFVFWWAAPVFGVLFYCGTDQQSGETVVMILLLLLYLFICGICSYPLIGLF
jgi:hypothetical protein